jgi:hypothetical protein
MTLMESKYRILDCHVHYSLPVKPQDIFDIMDLTKVEKANLVITPDRNRVSSVPDAMMVKSLNVNIYAFGSLDITQYFMHKKSVGKHFVKYVKRIREMGCDGIKMIEGKPDLRREVPIPDFDLPVWEPFWAYVEEVGFPILWHVNDPEEYWDESKIPSWAKKQNWFYGEDTINNEVQYAQVLSVLKKHPNLKIIFAHFFFMSAQLERLSKIFEEFPHVCVDLTPGIEMYINLSKNQEKAVQFFEKYSTRILYGTDIGARAVLPPYEYVINKAECMNRANIVQKFLTKSEEFTIKSDGNFLIGMDDFQLRTLHLKPEITQKIFYDNFIRIAGEKPKVVHPKLVIKECKRIKSTIKVMNLLKLIKNPDYSYADQVIEFFKNTKKKKTTRK